MTAQVSCCLQVEDRFEHCHDSLLTVVGLALGPLAGSFWFLGFRCPVVGGVLFLFLCPACGLVLSLVGSLVTLFVGFVCLFRLMSLL